MRLPLQMWLKQNAGLKALETASEVAQLSTSLSNHLRFWPLGLSVPRLLTTPRGGTSMQCMRCLRPSFAISQPLEWTCS